LKTIFQNSEADGSSPRPWGTLGPDKPKLRPIRFIPTPVGNTRSGADAPGLPAVHPHARGEHAFSSAPEPAGYGSSPRPWGTRCHYAQLVGEGRFIPTPVGNTRHVAAAHIETSVHPHARGEHADGAATLAGADGSSPRPWGTLPEHRRRHPYVRFIPTPVGNTARKRPVRALPAVHPHARGEHAAPYVYAAYQGGSSPRPWGTPRLAESRPSSVRFIPTPVGNTFEFHAGKATASVHPHARGEHQ